MLTSYMRTTMVPHGYGLSKNCTRNTRGCTMLSRKKKKRWYEAIVLGIVLVVYFGYLIVEYFSGKALHRKY